VAFSRAHVLGMSRLGPTLLVLALLLAPGCATNPVTGQTEFVLLSAAQEIELGRQSAKQFAEQLGLVDDPELVTYVAAIGNRLAEHSPRQDVSYHFQIADQEAPNAFALPGGWIYVSRGALAISNSEAELAGVIGHEIGHVAARHVVQQQTRSIGVGLLTLLGAAVAGAAGGEGAANVVGQLGQVAGAGLIATYGRGQELQADQVGQSLAARDGYDPAGIARFLTSLERDAERRAGGTHRQPSFFDSHPATERRVEEALERAATLERGGGRPLSGERSAYLARLEGLLVGPDPAAGLFRDERFVHPVLGFGVDFPKGWETQNGRKAVVAAAPDGNRILKLDAGPVEPDPVKAAAEFAQANRIVLDGGHRLTIGGLDAFRAHAQVPVQGGNAALHLTWIAHRRAGFRFIGVAPAAQAHEAFRKFDAVAASFGPLGKAERASIKEWRLAVVSARAGESLAGLARRSGNVWELPELAIANGLAANASLRAGQPIKIAREHPFRPR
jgi:predicted Zn-dependent protease